MNVRYELTHGSDLAKAAVSVMQRPFSFGLVAGLFGIQFGLLLCDDIRDEFGNGLGRGTARPLPGPRAGCLVRTLHRPKTPRALPIIVVNTSGDTLNPIQEPKLASQQVMSQAL